MESKFTYVLRKNIINTILISLIRNLRYAEGLPYIIGIISIIGIIPTTISLIENAFNARFEGAVLAGLLDIFFLILFGISVLAMEFVSVSISDSTEMENRIIAEENARKSNDPIDHLKSDMSKLNEYYAMNQNQLRYSFWLAIIAMLIGLFFLIIGLYKVFVSNFELNDGLKIISGAIVEVISGLFFTFYFKNQKRAQFYFDHLLQIQRILIAFNVMTQEKNKTISQKLKIAIIENLLKTDVRSLFKDDKK